MAVDWDAIQSMVDAGYKANPDGTITKPDGTRVRSNGRGGFTTVRDRDERRRDDAGAAVARGLLREFDLEELDRFVEDIARGRTTWEELEAQLYDPKSGPGKIVDRIYPELREARENGVPNVSIRAVLDYRQTARTVVNALGMDDAFPDLNKVVRDYITTGRDVSEFQGRLASIADSVAATIQNNPQAQQELDQWEAFYGVRPTVGELVSMAINPSFTEAQLQQRAQAVKIGAASVGAGFGQLTAQEAEGIQRLGFTDSQAREQFATLSGLGVGEGMTGQQVDVIDRSSQLDAAFGGNEFARRRIERRQRQQGAAFASGGGFAATNEGFSGLGSAQGR